VHETFSAETEVLMPRYQDETEASEILAEEARPRRNGNWGEAKALLVRGKPEKPKLYNASNEALM